mmetsp:Transcript_38440/g.83641  ORF Transcript_38440/g.83641 Transcript_38440/m.83641 type:complete len:203 (-) Transcript_38440:395-1003(-)
MHRCGQKLWRHTHIQRAIGLLQGRAVGAIWSRPGTRAQLGTQMKQSRLDAFCTSSSAPKDRAPEPSPTRRGQKRGALSTSSDGSRKARSLEQATTSASQTVAKEGRTGVTKLGDGAEIVFSPNMLPKAKCKELFEKLESEINWEHREIRMMGKFILQPRLIGGGMVVFAQRTWRPTLRFGTHTRASQCTRRAGRRRCWKSRR